MGWRLELILLVCKLSLEVEDAFFGQGNFDFFGDWRSRRSLLRVKLTRETWEKSSDDGVGKEEEGKEGAR